MVQHKPHLMFTLRLLLLLKLLLRPVPLSVVVTREEGDVVPPLRLVTSAQRKPAKTSLLEGFDEVLAIPRFADSHSTRSSSLRPATVVSDASRPSPDI